MRTSSYPALVPPGLLGFAAAAALDNLIDIRALFLPVIAGIAVVFVLAFGPRRKSL